MRCIATLTLLLATSITVFGQEPDAPAVEEVLRELSPDPHALDFVGTALPPPPSSGDSVATPVMAAHADLLFGGPVYMVGRGVTAPQPVKTPDPAYPRHAKQEGIVVIRVIIGSDGKVKEAIIKQSSTPEVDNAILKSLRDKWQFEPARYKGQPVAVQINIEFNSPR